MDVLGLIFSNIHNNEDFEVTQVRTIASLPIGGRYRLIDFPLSSFANLGVNHVGIVTKTNYQSLMDHIGSGKEWDLARKKGGIVFLPPYTNGGTVYNSRLEAVKNQISFINGAKEEYVILTDCYSVCNIDYKLALDYHLEKGADITCIYKKGPVQNTGFATPKVFKINKEGRITKLDQSGELKGVQNLSTDTWIMKRSLLVNIVEESMITNYKSFNRDVFGRNLKNYKIYGYEHKGYYRNINDLNSYFSVNMDLLSRDIRRELFYEPGQAIYTKVRDSAPTKYSTDCLVKNSLIADGCIIEGEVENCVVFRGAKVGKGAKVKNSILMQDTVVSPNVTLEYVITDKNVTIANKKELLGDSDRPIYIQKGGKL